MIEWLTQYAAGIGYACGMYVAFIAGRAAWRWVKSHWPAAKPPVPLVDPRYEDLQRQFNEFREAFEEAKRRFPAIEGPRREPDPVS